MNLFTQAAIRHVEASGFRVIPLADPPDLNEAAAALGEAGMLVFDPCRVDFGSVIIPLLRAQHYQVFPPPAAPERGTAWTPTRGEATATRVVGQVTPSRVGYFVAGVLHWTGIAGWHHWRRRTRARRSP